MSAAAALIQQPAGVMWEPFADKRVSFWPAAAHWQPYGRDSYRWRSGHRKSSPEGPQRVESACSQSPAADLQDAVAQRPPMSAIHLRPAVALARALGPGCPLRGRDREVTIRPQPTAIAAKATVGGATSNFRSGHISVTRLHKTDLKRPTPHIVNIALTLSTCPRFTGQSRRLIRSCFDSFLRPFNKGLRHFSSNFPQQAASWHRGCNKQHRHQPANPWRRQHEHDRSY